MGHVEIVLRLLEAGARPDIQDKVYCCIVAKHYTSVVVSSKIGYVLSSALEVHMNVYLKCFL